MTDLNQIVPASRDLPLVHPRTDEELGWIFILKPETHPDVVAAEREWQNAKLAKRRGTLTAEAIEAMRLKVLISAVEGWRFDPDNEFTIEGDQPDFSPGLLKKILTDEKYRWIFNWMNRELGDEGAFFGEPKK